MNAQVANGFIVADPLVAGKGTAPADPLVAGMGTAPADPLVAGKGTAPENLDDADGWKAAGWADCAELDDEDVAGEEEESAAAGGGVAPHPLGQPAAPLSLLSARAFLMIFNVFMFILVLVHF